MIEQPWARPGVAGGNSAVYLTLVNPGEHDEHLLGASSPAATVVEIHETMVMPGDVVHMQPVEAVEVPAGGRVEFQPGGLHLMMTGLTRTLEAADQVELTLLFEEAGEITFLIDVLQP